jgi:hypothetical protein
VRPTSAYLPPQRCGPLASFVIADVLGGILFALLAAALFWRRTHRRRAAAARAAAPAPRELVPGDAVVAGKVVIADGRDAAITIDIDQDGHEWQSKSGWMTTWKETDRRVEARPFYIQRAHGERVRVEPDGSVFLVDRLDGEARTGPDTRTRSARLTEGELVFASGVLVRGMDPQAGGYRDGSLGWVLRPRRGERMLISTEPQAQRHDRRARFHGGWVIAFLIAIGVLHGLLFGGYHALRFRGETVLAHIENLTSYRVWVQPKSGRGHWSTHYVLAAAYVDARDNEQHVSDEVDGSFWYRAHQERDQPVPFRVVPSLRLAQVGSEATLAVWRAIVGCTELVFLLILYPATVVGSRPWYDRRRVVEQVKGRL